MGVKSWLNEVKPPASFVIFLRRNLSSELDDGQDVLVRRNIERGVLKRNKNLDANSMSEFDIIFE